MPFEILDINYTKFSTVKSALLLFRFHILSLIRSFTTGSGTSFLLRWSLQSLNWDLPIFALGKWDLGHWDWESQTQNWEWETCLEITQHNYEVNAQ